MSTGTFPKDIVGLRFGRGICLHVYRPIFEVYVEFESTGTSLGFKLDLKVIFGSKVKVGFEMSLEIFQQLFTKFQNSLYFHIVLVLFVLCFGMLI